jgi:3-hydroxybutyryl-CoA dehydrogenase
MTGMESLEDIRTIGVIGAGQMGGGIAQVAAASGLSVVLVDSALDLADRGKARIAQLLARQVDRGKMPAEARLELLGRIRTAGALEQVSGCDFVVEAASERLDVKVAVLRGCDAVLAPGKCLASNTSSISLTKLAAATSRPDRVIGMHFMNPPPLMKLVEVVRAVQTSDATHALTLALAARMGKTTTTTTDAPAFLVNRILIPLLCEACFALQEGVGSVADIDTSAKLGLNHPMGPFELSDLIGLDTVFAIAEVMHREFGDDKYRAPTTLRNLVAAGWLGRKTGRGFYRYDEKGDRAGSAV